MLRIFFYILQLDYCAHDQKTRGQQLIGMANKKSICDTHRPYQVIQSILKPVFADFDSFVVPMSYSDAQMWGSGNFCDHDDRQQMTDKNDCFTPCTCMRGKYVRMYHEQLRQDSFYTVSDLITDY